TSRPEPQLLVAAPAEEAVRPEPRQQLVQQLLATGHLVREQLGREQALDEIVDAPVSLAPCEPEHAAHRVRLEHGTRDVRWSPEPVDGGTPLEVERRQRPFRADPLEDPGRDLRLLREDALS